MNFAKEDHAALESLLAYSHVLYHGVAGRLPVSFQRHSSFSHELHCDCCVQHVQVVNEGEDEEEG
jgi:hypothetical protein